MRSRESTNERLEMVLELPFRPDLSLAWDWQWHDTHSKTLNSCRPLKTTLSSSQLQDLVEQGMILLDRRSDEVGLPLCCMVCGGGSTLPVLHWPQHSISKPHDERTEGWQEVPRGEEDWSWLLWRHLPWHQ